MWYKQTEGEGKREKQKEKGRDGYMQCGERERDRKRK